jgi:predicted SAM-dependent methyltransferase
MNLKYPRKLLRFHACIEREIDAVITQIRQTAVTGLHLGAGNTKIPGLINCDLFNEKAEKRIDCTKLDEYPDDSVDLIETHHFIEHLSFADTDNALKEWARVTRPGGYLIVTCPDMTSIAVTLLKLTIRQWGGLYSEKKQYPLKMVYGTQEHEGMFHKSGYNRFTLSRLLARHGFCVEFFYTPYPRRSTPSLLIIAKKT